MTNLAAGNLENFNDIRYAHYTNAIDVCLLPLCYLQTGTNGLFKPPKGNNHLSSWDETAAPEGCMSSKLVQQPE
jgi:hypothetical protein